MLFKINVNKIIFYLLFSSPKKDDFEIRKKEDSVQKKRHYRSNRSHSSENERSSRQVTYFLNLIKMHFAVLNNYCLIAG